MRFVSISGDVVIKTLVLTDLVGSTRMVERLGDVKAYQVGRRHDRLARDVLARRGGREIDKTDGFLLLFERPIDAVSYAIDYHQALEHLSEELGLTLEARVGIHLGEVLLRENSPQDVARGAKPLEVDGLAKPVAARLMSLAQGRQTLLSRAAFELARRAAVGHLSGPQVRWTSHGPFKLKGVDEPLEIFEVGIEGKAPLAPPPDSDKAKRAKAREAVAASRMVRNPFYHRQGITDARSFFGRAEVVRSLLEMVASGQSCAVVGERRIGKSSLLAYLAHPEVQRLYGVDAEHTLCTVLDFLALPACSPGELWVEVLEALEVATRDVSAAEVLRAATAGSEVSFTDLRRTLRKLRRLGFRVVLLCDEFELAVRNPRFDQAFFGALRSLAGGEGVVFVTASRHSLLELEQYQSEEVRQKVLGSPFFNIFAEFSLGPFVNHEIAAMLATLLEPTPIRFSRQDVALLGRLAGRHPYFLQLTAYHLYAVLERARRGSGDTLVTSISGEVEAQVRSESEKIFHTLWQHSSAAEKRALAALALLAQGQELRSSVGVEPAVLGRLERRGLVIRERSPADATEVPQSVVLKSCRPFSDLLAAWVHDNTSVTLEGLERQDSDFHFEPPPPLVPDGGVSVRDRFSILEEIGRGGTGTVFKAWDDHLQRIVAIKVLAPELRVSDHLQRLLAEARICAGLNHPNIVVVHDVDVERAQLVQELVAGGSLRDLLEEVPILAAGDVLSLAEDLVSALGAAHHAGVVHRDLKPENVLLTSRLPVPATAAGRLLPAIKLGDFGTALRVGEPRRTKDSGVLAGTLAYMAPEQLTGGKATPASDFYALGVVLYEVRHGERPPSRDTQAAALENATDGPAAPLDGLIARCLADRPGERFQDAGELSRILEEARVALG